LTRGGAENAPDTTDAADIERQRAFRKRRLRETQCSIGVDGRDLLNQTAFRERSSSEVCS